MNVIVDYDIYIKNKPMWSRIFSGLFEQNMVNLYMLCDCSKDQYDEIERQLRARGVFCIFVFTEGRSKQDVISEIKEKIDIVIGDVKALV
jgi:hypothetical protein